MTTLNPGGGGAGGILINNDGPNAGMIENELL